jgi:hypothetical protein
MPALARVWLVFIAAAVSGDALNYPARFRVNAVAPTVVFDSICRWLIFTAVISADTVTLPIEFVWHYGEDRAEDEGKRCGK